MLTDSDKRDLVEEINSYYAYKENNLKTIFLMNQEIFGNNFYGRMQGKSFNEKIISLVHELILRNKLDDFIRIVRQDYPNFAISLQDKNEEQSQQSSSSGTRWKVESVPANPEQYYAELENMLRSNNWEEADQITGEIIWELAGKLRDRSFKAEVSRKFPCEVLRTIDELWTEYSDGRFGFSVQRKIWQSNEVNRDINKFMIRVGWTGWWKGEDGEDVLGFVPANFFDNALKEGQLPWLVTWEGSDGIRDRKAYLSKIVRCGI